MGTFQEYTIPLRVPASAARWPRHITARHRIQHAFHNWHRINKSNFLIELDLIERSSSMMHFGFVGIDRTISVILSRNDLSVFVWRPEPDRKDEFVDMLVSYSTSPKRVPGGYICEQCRDFIQSGYHPDPEAKLVVLPTREAVWESDLFEPFLVWVNQSLAPATTLYVSEGYATFDLRSK